MRHTIMPNEQGVTQEQVTGTKPKSKPEQASEVKPEPKPEPVPEPKPEVKPEPKPESAPEVKPEPKPESAPEVKPEVKSEPKPEAEQEDQVASVAKALAAERARTSKYLVEAGLQARGLTEADIQKIGSFVNYETLLGEDGLPSKDRLDSLAGMLETKTKQDRVKLERGNFGAPGESSIGYWRERYKQAK